MGGCIDMQQLQKTNVYSSYSNENNKGTVFLLFGDR